MSLLKRDLEEVGSNLFLLSILKSQSPGFDRGSLGLFPEKGTDILPEVGTSDQQIVQNSVEVK